MLDNSDIERGSVLPAKNVATDELSCVHKGHIKGHIAIGIPVDDLYGWGGVARKDCICQSDVVGVHSAGHHVAVRTCGAGTGHCVSSGPSGGCGKEWHDITDIAATCIIPSCF